MYLVLVQNVKLDLNWENYKLQQGFRACVVINALFHKLYQWNLYSSACKFVIADTDENGENWYMTNNNHAIYSNW